MGNPQKERRIDMAEAVRVGMFAAGMVLVAYGTWRIHEPSGFIVAGLMMFGCAVIGALRAEGGK